MRLHRIDPLTGTAHAALLTSAPVKRGGHHVSAVPLTTYADFVADAVAAMSEVLHQLGDKKINRRPALPGANSPCAIVVHCCGVMEWWGAHVIAGRSVNRDRDAEFRATGSVAEVDALLVAQHQRLLEDLTALVPGDPPRGGLPVDGRYGRSQPTQGHAAMHLYEELAHHLGHLDLTADLLNVSRA